MTGTTTYEGYPYPLTTDFGDVQDAFRLATAVDTDLRGAQGPLRAFMGRPAFIGRQTSTQTGFITGSQTLQMQTLDFDNTGGVQAGAFAWLQPYSQGPSWWMFGCTILVAPTGAQVVDNMNMAQIQVYSVDQVTNQTTLSNYYQRNDDSGTNGEWINMFCMVPIYQGQAQCNLILNGSTTKAIGTGSRFWGMYMGPVT